MKFAEAYNLEEATVNPASKKDIKKIKNAKISDAGFSKDDATEIVLKTDKGFFRISATKPMSFLFFKDEKDLELPF